MTTDANPSPIQSLLDLFTTALADVRFADLDGQTLARVAPAYARVYAESDEALTERLGAIALPRGTRRVRATGDTLVLSPDPEPTPRPRGRPRKQNASEPLPAAPPPVGE